MNHKESDKLANAIVSRLFTNGFGECGDRLVIIQQQFVDGNERNLGGWCIESVRREIIEAINELD